MWISSWYGCCKRRGVIDPRIGRGNQWERSRQVWSGGGRSGSPDDCREVCKDAEREAQTGAASVCLRGRGWQFGWLHVAVYCMHVYLWVSPPRATHASPCASCLPSSSLLEKQILMRFCYMRVIWLCHTLVVSILSCVIMRNMQCLWNRRGKSPGDTSLFPRTADGLLCLVKSEKSARRWMSWGKDNHEGMGKRGGNKENQVKSLKSSTGEDGRAFWGKENFRWIENKHNFSIYSCSQWHNILLLLSIHSFTSIMEGHVCVTHVLSTRDIKIKKTPFLTLKCSLSIVHSKCIVCLLH